MQKKFIILIQLTILSFLANTIIAQQVTVTENGEEITDYGNVISFYDPFTDDLTIRSKHFRIQSKTVNGDIFRLMPVFSGKRECDIGFCGDFSIRIILEGSSIIDFFGMSDRSFFEEIFLSTYPILFDENRDEISVDQLSYDEMGEMLRKAVIEYSDSTAIDVDLYEEQFMSLKNSEVTKIRIEGTVIDLGDEIKSEFSRIEEILKEYSGQDVNESKERNKVITSSPYELKWEGNIARDPLVQPLPENASNSEGVISVRFQVKPDGTVGLIIPLKKMNPELEKEIQRTLKDWEFSKLPSGVPQQDQWGTITFRVLFD